MKFQEKQRNLVIFIQDLAESGSTEEFMEEAEEALDNTRTR